MYDFAVVNRSPGQCEKCRGTGQYCWGAIVNGKPTHSATCHSCRGTGQQTRKDMARNAAYNRHKISQLASGHLRG